MRNIAGQPVFRKRQTSKPARMRQTTTSLSRMRRSASTRSQPRHLPECRSSSFHLEVSKRAPSRVSSPNAASLRSQALDDRTDHHTDRSPTSGPLIVG
jgi:hypothetical protein